MHMDREIGSDSLCLSINNQMGVKGRITGEKSWVEGCHIRSEITLAGENVVVGADVDKPFSLPEKKCLDIIQGQNRIGKKVWFVRIYGIDDSFKDPEKNLWNEKKFPAVSSPNDYHQWLWMTDPAEATADHIQAWHKADKYSLAEISSLVDLENFYDTRQKNRAKEIFSSLGHMFQPESHFSAADLTCILEELNDQERKDWLTRLFTEAQRHPGFMYARIAHTLGSAIKSMLDEKEQEWTESLYTVYETLADQEKEWWNSRGLDLSAFKAAKTWCERALDSAYDNLSQAIVRSKNKPEKYPSCSLRPNETISGWAPARLDLGGGWTDTPPYALERGGCVINTAVNLNGKPPIHVSARVVEKPEIRIVSIDHNSSVTIKDLEDLMDYKKATGKFALAKAALVLSGFSPERSIWPSSVNSLEDMMEHFGGGIELTTSAAIPSGSGLGTSSIMGAVLISVINKLTGKETTQRELFNLVLQLEQELTTGGGWQDQIGGTIEGVKMISTEPGLVPDPKIKSVKPDLLHPVANNGQTLLYYTGMRRLAKNILRNIVGNYLDRDRPTMEALRKLHAFPPFLVDAMESADMLRFGQLIHRALQLKKEIDPGSSNPEMEKILEKFKPYMIGATFLGAGGGGFLLVVCTSPKDAVEARKMLEKDPPNPQARFYDYEISSTGLEITVN